MPHLLDGGVGYFAEEIALDAEPEGVADGAADDAAQYIAAPFVAWHNAVSNKKGYAAPMLCDHADGIGVIGVVVAFAADTLDGGDDGREQVGLIRRVHILKDSDEALESHAGVHARRGQGRARAVEMMVILHEDEVPQLDIAVAHDAVRHDIGAVGRAVVSEAAVLRAVVVVEFAARSARSLVARGSPPVFVVAVAIHLVGGDAFRLPQSARFLVGVVDCGGELFERDAVALCHQLDREIDGACLEVVAEAEVAEHLEERVVRGVADLFDVRSAEALLRSGSAPVGRLRLAGEVRLELNHARGRQQQRGVADRNQR